MSLVIVRYHREPEGWWAESDQATGWSAAGDTFTEVRAMAHEGVRQLVDPDAEIFDDLNDVRDDLVMLTGTVASGPPGGDAMSVAMFSATVQGIRRDATPWPSRPASGTTSNAGRVEAPA